VGPNGRTVGSLCLAFAAEIVMAAIADEKTTVRCWSPCDGMFLQKITQIVSYNGKKLLCLEFCMGLVSAHFILLLVLSCLILGCFLEISADIHV